MLFSEREAEHYVATAFAWGLILIFALTFAVIFTGVIINSNFDALDDSFANAIQRTVDTCTDQTHAFPPDPEQVRGRAPGLSGDDLYTRQTEARAQRTLDPPLIQKPPGWGEGKALFPAPLPTGEVGW